MFQIEGDCSWPMELCAIKVKCHLAVRSTHTPVTTLYLLVLWLTRCCHLALTIFVLRLVGFLALLYVLCSLLGNLKLSGLTIQPYACKHTHTPCILLVVATIRLRFLLNWNYVGTLSGLPLGQIISKNYFGE